MENKLKFKIIKKKGNARIGEINLNGKKVETPIFMPVGTRATIRGMILDLLKDPKYIGDIKPINLILANTFHLYLRPGLEIIKQSGGLHKFMNWDGLILTDSGGFQVFSLGLSNSEKRKVNLADQSYEKISSKKGKNVFELKEEGVYFTSPYDGSKHFFSPEKVVDIQIGLGSDIMMVLDVCSPANSDNTTLKQQMEITHRWAKRAFDYFLPKYEQANGVLFPIVQGGTDKKLRKQSIEFLSQYAIDGIAVGGVSVGEEKHLINEIVEFTGPKLPEDKPRYLMGVGTPEDILFAIEHGFDMFDCVLATRLGRHGLAFTSEGRLKITKSAYRKDFSPLDPNCNCFVCKNFNRAYLQHLFREKELLGGILLSLHNIVYLEKILENWKKTF